ncbi:MAG: Spy/CpxP family protein refolding chaperone [Deltaproteobacteria bacterium]|nr:Spy/CpxP family protein refolding chaperone [Deltaproteobacteria bacterium]
MIHSPHVIRRSLAATSLALAALVLIPSSAAAQGNGERAVQVVANTLQLDELQVEQWGAIRVATAEAVEPIAAEIEALQGELDELLASDNPDPAAVGELILALRNLRQQILAIGQAATGEFEALLSEEQAQRLNAVRRAARLQRVLPAFRVFHLLGQP